MVEEQQQEEGLRPPMRRSARVAAVSAAAATQQQHEEEEDRPPQLERTRKRARTEAAPPPAAAAAAAAASPKPKRKKPSSDKSKKKQTKKSSATVTVEALQMEDCGICFSDDYEFSAKLNSCDHRFCFACISKWGESSNTCPQCKRRFTKLEKRTRAGKKVSTKQVSKRDLGSSNGAAAGLVGFEGLFPVSGLMGTPGGGVFPLHGGAALANMLLSQNGANPVSALMIFQSILMGMGMPSGFSDDDEDDEYGEDDHLFGGLFGPYGFDGGGYDD